MIPARFHPEAEAEMNAAAAYYEDQQEHLGGRFLAAVQDALNRFQLNSLLYRVIEADVRRCKTRTFPYGVLFQIRPDKYAIIAVMHLHRDPDCWKKRISALPVAGESRLGTGD